MINSGDSSEEEYEGVFMAYSSEVTSNGKKISSTEYACAKKIEKKGKEKIETSMVCSRCKKKKDPSCCLTLHDTRDIKDFIEGAEEKIKSGIQQVGSSVLPQQKERKSNLSLSFFS